MRKTIYFKSLVMWFLFGGLFFTGASAAKAAGEDPNLIQAYFEPGSEIKDAVGLRYKFRVNNNQSSGLKIIFNGLAFYNPDTGKGWNYFLENNIYSNWIKYFDNQYNCKWPPQGQYFRGQAGFWVSISDYWKNGLVGVRQADENIRNMFPRQNSGIDNISGLTKIETISQMNMNEKDVSVEILRGDIFKVTTPLDGWGYRYVPDPNNQGNYLCESKLPPAEYRIWKVTSMIDGITYRHEFLMPEAYAKYIHPGIKNFFTEFFKNSGFFQTYFWEIEFLRENVSDWEPLRKWKVGTSYEGTDSRNNGFKLATYNNHSVIEVSNDMTDTYYKMGDIFELLSRPNHPPALSFIGDETVNEDESLSFDISATDEDNDPLTYTASGLPQGANFINRTFSFRPNYNQAGTYHPTFSVSDGRGGADSKNITITVNNVNRAPALSPIGGKSVYEGELLSFTINATDADNDPLTYSASELPSGANFTNQTFSFIPNYNQAGTYYPIFEVKDSSQAHDVETILLEVKRRIISIEINDSTWNLEGVTLNELRKNNNPDTGSPLHAVKNAGNVPVIVEIGYSLLLPEEITYLHPGLTQGIDTYITKIGDVVLPPFGRTRLSGVILPDQSAPVRLILGTPTALSHPTGGFGVRYEIRAYPEVRAN